MNLKRAPRSCSIFCGMILDVGGVRDGDHDLYESIIQGTSNPVEECLFTVRHAAMRLTVTSLTGHALGSNPMPRRNA